MGERQKLRGQPLRIKIRKKPEKKRRRVSNVSLAAWLLLGTVGASPAAAQLVMMPTQPMPGRSMVDCRGAALLAEQEMGLPPGLLFAIGRVETGRPNPTNGQIEPWPWSTDMAGASHYFSSENEAIVWTAAQLDSGQRSIDIGCFQVNVMYHPDAFATLEEAFDPLANARYAARFLISLYQRTGSWQVAAAQYHSADPARGIPYGDRVLAQLGGGAPPARFGVQVITPGWTTASVLGRPGFVREVSTEAPVIYRMPPPHPGERGLPRVITPGTGGK